MAHGLELKNCTRPPSRDENRADGLSRAAKRAQVRSNADCFLGEIPAKIGQTTNMLL
jgi:hypothetical protein